MNDNEYCVHETGYAAIDAAQRVLELLQAFIGAVQVDQDAVRRHIDASCITMTELADSLVREEGLAFAQAHEVCSRLSRVMAASRSTLATVAYDTFAGAFADVIGRPASLGEPAFRRFTSAEHFIAVRTRPGGPAPAPMDQMLATYRDRLHVVRAALAGYRRQRDTAATQLEEQIRRVAGGR